ncbi:hypothetical protein ACEPAF_6442 [Sanghuangporus sanghuang]
MAETFEFDQIENVQIPCLLNRKIDNGRFKLIKRIGHGGYSVVYLAVNLFHHPRSSYPSRVAVKCLLSSRKQKFQREVEIHKRAARHVRGVIRIYRTLQEGDLFFVILEYCPQGDLFSAITESRTFLGNDRLIKGVFIQLIEIIMLLHNVGIYHRDLKPENVLCVLSPQDLRKGQPTNVLLADFGLATENPMSESFGCGSYYYMTPECLAGSYSTRVKAYSSPAADIWALGIMLVNLVCGRSPWKAAMLTDPSFRRFARDCRWLRQMLPLSMPAYNFLSWIFKSHGNNICMSELRRRFLKIDTFYMTRAELAEADKTARLVASDWMLNMPLQDVDIEGDGNITHMDEVDQQQLFDDSIHVDPCDNNSDTSVSSCSNTDTYSFSSPAPSSNWTTPFSSVGGRSTNSASSSSESDFPITPETKPVRPAESVPELPKGQQPIASENWVLSADEVHSFHKTLSTHVLQHETLEVERLVL